MSEEIVEKENKEIAYLKPILGVLILLLVIILGGLYLWSTVLERGLTQKPEIVPRSIPNQEPETLRAETDAEILTTTSSSDELTAIESDTLSTNLDSLDTELTQIDQEMTAELNRN